MPGDPNDTPKETATGAVKRPRDAQTDRAADGKTPQPGEGATAGGRDTGFGGEKQGADHDTEEAAAYRENDA